jgi:hypothetical protein
MPLLRFCLLCQGFGNLRSRPPQPRCNRKPFRHMQKGSYIPQAVFNTTSDGPRRDRQAAGHQAVPNGLRSQALLALQLDAGRLAHLERLSLASEAW